MSLIFFLVATFSYLLFVVLFVWQGLQMLCVHGSARLISAMNNGIAS
jgi:hypothetical protein